MLKITYICKQKFNEIRTIHVGKKKMEKKNKKYINSNK